MKFANRKAAKGEHHFLLRWNIFLAGIEPGGQNIRSVAHLIKPYACKLDW